MFWSPPPPLYLTFAKVDPIETWGLYLHIFIEPSPNGILIGTAVKPSIAPTWNTQLVLSWRGSLNVSAELLICSCSLCPLYFAASCTACLHNNRQGRMYSLSLFLHEGSWKNAGLFIFIIARLLLRKNFVLLASKALKAISCSLFNWTLWSSSAVFW